MFEFANPWMFLALPVPLLVRWLVPAYQETQDSIRVPFFHRLVELTGQAPRKGAVILQRVFFQKVWVPITWVLLVTAMAEPLWVGEPIEHTKSARDLMVAVDLSGSMEITDFKAADGKEISRLEAVKQVLAEFAEQREHDRLGLIVFGDSPYLQVPFTEDHRTWLALLDETEIAMAGQSTMFGDANGDRRKLSHGASGSTGVDVQSAQSSAPIVDTALTRRRADVAAQGTVGPIQRSLHPMIARNTGRGSSGLR